GIWQGTTQSIEMNNALAPKWPRHLHLCQLIKMPILLWINMPSGERAAANGKMCELLHTSAVVQKMQNGQKTPGHWRVLACWDEKAPAIDGWGKLAEGSRAALALNQKSWPHFRPPPVDFCGSRLAIGAAPECARAPASARYARPSVTNATLAAS